MKKITTLVLGLFCLTFSFAQDIKTKKNKILFEKKEIAQIKSSKNVYNISSLEGSPILTIESNKIEITASSGMTYYTIILPDESKKKNINNPGKINAFFPEKKLLLDFAFGPFKLFTTAGIDTDVIDQMFESDQSELDLMLDYRIQSRKDVKAHIEQFSKSKLTFNGQDLSSFGYTKGFSDFVKLGSIERKTDEVQKRYRIMDNQGTVLAVWNAREDNMLRIPGEDEAYYIHHNNATNSTMSLSNDNLAQAMLGYLLEKHIIVIPQN